MLTVYVLKTPNSNRSDRLIESLSRINGVDVNVVNSTMIFDYQEVIQNKIQVNYNYASIYMGRKILPTEIGCSHTHNVARNLLSKTKYGGVILEDDAEVINLVHFKDVCIEFLNANFGKPSVLSLYNPEPQVDRDQKVIPRFFPLFGFPKLAVGYAITPSASRNLLQSNSPIRFVADWPVSNSRYFMVKSSLVSHSHSVASTITQGAEDIRVLNHSRIRYILRQIHENNFKLKDLCSALDIAPKVLNNFVKFRLDRFFH